MNCESLNTGPGIWGYSPGSLVTLFSSPSLFRRLSHLYICIFIYTYKNLFSYVSNEKEKSLVENNSF